MGGVPLVSQLYDLFHCYLSNVQLRWRGDGTVGGDDYTVARPFKLSTTMIIAMITIITIITIIIAMI